jgi:two-component system, chemotaxis family, sensor kinase CheA
VKPGASELAVEEQSESFLIFEARDRERTALPLDMVERIESVSLDRIEYAGGRPMLQYRGEPLPLRDEGNVLPSLKTERQLGQETLATILICDDRSSDGPRRTGVVVRQVLDVSPGTLLEQNAISDGTGMELALVKEKLTIVHRKFSAKMNGAWQEVA